MQLFRFRDRVFAAIDEYRRVNEDTFLVKVIVTTRTLEWVALRRAIIFKPRASAKRSRLDPLLECDDVGSSDGAG